MAALRSLEVTQRQLAGPQKQVPTNVAGSGDDGAALAIAQSVRLSIGALTGANQQLGEAQGLLATTQTALHNISNTMGSMRDVLVKLSDPGVTGKEQTNYETQYKSMLANVRSFIADSSYNGKSLIGDIASPGGNTKGYGSVFIATSGDGGIHSLAAHSYSAIYASLAGVTTAFAGAGGAAAMRANLTSSGMFMSKQYSVRNDLATIGSALNYVSDLADHGSNKIDSLNKGLGSIVDSDLNNEAARLTSLTIRNQLGTHGLSLGNQSPQALLRLFN